MATNKDFKIKNGITVENGALVIGEDAYSSSTDYVGLKTSYMTGANDYMIISGKSDGSTFVSARNGSDVLIRGGGNLGSNQIKVPDSNYIEMKTSQLRFTGGLYAGTTEIITSSRNLTNIGTISAGVTTITSSGTIGGSTVANGYLKITDGTNTLGFDTNEVHTTDNLYLNAEDGTIYLRGNNGGAVTLKNGGITFMNTTRDLQNIGNINAGTNLYLGNANKTRISSDNNGEVAINYATTTGTTASSFGIYDNTTRTITLKRDGSVISSGGTSYFPKLESPEYRNTTIVSNATTPTNTAGWFKIAKVTRGAGKILLSFTGGNYSPDTYVIEYFKNWSTTASLTLKQFSNSSFITKAKIRQDSSDNNY